MPSHDETILDQFTRQAVPFATAPAIRDEKALELLVETCGATAADTVLDVACGPGLVVAAFARVVHHATGIDLTPAMIDQARRLAAEKGLTNVSWQVGPVLPLPCPDASYSIVTCRFAFHHLQDPGTVLGEMKRVCTRGGTVMLVDVAASPNPVVAARFNRMERLRDPSHVRALTLAEMQALFAARGLSGLRATSYRLEAELEGLLERSFPVAGGAEEIRRMFAASLEGEDLGLDVRREGTEIRLAYPVAVLAARVAD